MEELKSHKIAHMQKKLDNLNIEKKEFLKCDKKIEEL